MDVESLRKFKHDLRTPVNHILGYSELLLEAASDAGDGRLADFAKCIHDNGKKLATLMEKNLPSSAAPSDMLSDAFRADIRAIAKQILGILTDGSGMAGMNLYADDLGRIRDAANQLIVLIG